MNRKKMKEQAIILLCCKEEGIEEIDIPEIDAVYYRDRKRGGGAVILSENGEMLFEDPFFVDIKEHLNRYVSGERTHFEV